MTHLLLLFQNPHNFPGTEGEQALPSASFHMGHREVVLGPQRSGAKAGIKSKCAISCVIFISLGNHHEPVSLRGEMRRCKKKI